jgi:hypothetical protein
MKFTTPIPFAEALEKLRERKITPTALGTEELALIPVELRERAFFSAKVESARVLQSMKDYGDDFLAANRMDNGGLKATGRAEFVADMRELAIREGLGKVDPETGRINPLIAESDLTDIRSISRLELIFDTMTEAAQEYGYFIQGQDPAILDVFPAQRFIRIRPVSAPRSYHAANEGTVKRKDDTAFWLSMNRDFGVPWGPWGFNSGMGVEDVDRDEAIALGVMKESATVKPVKRKFNEGLEASTRGLDGDILAALARSTGGTSANGALTPRDTPAPRVPLKFNDEAQAVEFFKNTLGIANVEFSAGSQARIWGAKISSKKARLAHLETVADEMDRLVAKYPGLKGKLDTFLCTKSARGRAHLNGPKSHMTLKTVEWPDSTWERIERHFQNTGRNHTTERKGSQVRDNFRHELGHTLSTPKAIADFDDLLRKEGWNLDWFKQNVSEYAGTKKAEAIADSFGFYTRENYQAGTLPASLESYLENLTR